MLDRAAAYLSAHLRAFERLQGAVEASAPAGVRDARATESVKYSIDAAVNLDAAVPQLRFLAATEPPPREVFRRTSPAPSAPGDLPDGVLALLYLGGFPIAALQHALGSPPEDVPLLSEYNQESIVLSEFADHLKTWTPPPRWGPPELL